MKLKPYSNLGAKKFGIQMDGIRALFRDEMSEAMRHLDNSIAILRLLCATAREDAEAAYYAVLPYDKSMGNLRLWLNAVKAKSRKLDENERAGRFMAETIYANFFPACMHKGLRLTEIGQWNFTSDRIILRFARGKDRFELWAPNLDTIKGQGTERPEVPTKLEEYSKLWSMVNSRFNFWEMSMYLVTDEKGITSLSTISESYSPDTIRGELEKWEISRKRSKK